jgi:hypothetical protein
MTDSLIKIFSRDSYFWNWPRNIALHKLERSQLLKKELNQLMMGLKGRLNRLARGLPLTEDSPL